MNLFDKFKSTKSKDTIVPDMEPDENVEQEIDTRGSLKRSEAI